MAKSNAGKYAVSNIMNLNAEEFSSLSKDELERVYKNLSSVVNRRITNLKKEKLSRFSLALTGLRGGKKHKGKIRLFTMDRVMVKGKNGSYASRQKMMKEIARGLRFLNAKTSTITGVRKVIRNVTKKIGKFRSKKQMNEFWDAYNALMSDYHDVIRGRKISTDEFQTMLYDRSIGNKNTNIDELIDNMRQELETRYVKEETAGEEDTPFKVMYEEIIMPWNK